MIVRGIVRSGVCDGVDVESDDGVVINPGWFKHWKSPLTMYHD